MKELLPILSYFPDEKWFINCAISFNGMLSESGKQVNLSNEEDWNLVHNIRNKLSAIVVGANTIQTDDPSLLTKEQYIAGEVSHPVRVILDRSGILANKYQVFQTIEITPTIWVTSSDEIIDGVIKIKYRIDLDIKQSIEIELGKLNRYGYIMIEGGGSVISYALQNNWVVFLRIFRSSIIINNGVPMIKTEILSNRKKLKIHSFERLGDGVAEFYTINP